MTGEFRPSAPLLAAIREAMRILAVQWPRAMQAATAASQDGDQVRESYARACLGADLTAITEAARQWCAAEEFAPKPHALGKLAHDLTRERKAAEGPPAAASGRSILDGARPFWFERTTLDGTHYAQGWALTTGGSVGIAEPEMDRLLAGSLRWGWGVGPMEKAS